MKAILHTRFGPPEELQLAEVERPSPKDDEVLIRVRATTVTGSDCNVRDLTFVPNLFRLPARLFVTGVFKPRVRILGVDLAGEVVAAGKNVKRFKKGDHVFGSPESKFGAHAEYICLPETAALATKPPGLSWEEAAAVTLAASTALYFIRDLGKIQAGQTILIHGASGGIGTFAVQLAKYYGAQVTGVCSTPNLEMVRSLGADTVIDYTREDFTAGGVQYDCVFDVVGKTSYAESRASLKEGGVYLENCIRLPELFHMLRTLTTGSKSKKVKGGMAVATRDNVGFLKDLLEKGALKVVIDRIYPLERMAEAFRYVEGGHKKGNVAITVH